MFKVAKKFPKFKIDKRFYVIGSLVLLLGLTIWLNVAFNNNDDTQINAGSDDTTTQTSGNFFVDFRSNRQKTRDKELQDLDTIINNASTDAATLSDAQQMKLQISSNMEKELIIEGILVARGFEDAVVTINNGSINVIVKQDTITTEQAAQIYDTVVSETSAKAADIKIMTSA